MRPHATRCIVVNQIEIYGIPSWGVRIALVTTINVCSESNRLHSFQWCIFQCFKFVSCTMHTNSSIWWTWNSVDISSPSKEPTRSIALMRVTNYITGNWTSEYNLISFWFEAVRPLVRAEPFNTLDMGVSEEMAFL